MLGIKQCNRCHPAPHKFWKVRAGGLCILRVPPDSILIRSSCYMKRVCVALCSQGTKELIALHWQLHCSFIEPSIVA